MKLSLSLSPSIYPTMNIIPSCSHLSHKVLVARYFQNDANAGNFMLLKDGRMGLIGMECANSGLICTSYADLILHYYRCGELSDPF